MYILTMRHPIRNLIQYLKHCCKTTHKIKNILHNNNKTSFEQNCEFYIFMSIMKLFFIEIQKLFKSTSENKCLHMLGKLGSIQHYEFKNTHISSILL